MAGQCQGLPCMHQGGAFREGDGGEGPRQLCQLARVQGVEQRDGAQRVHADGLVQHGTQGPHEGPDGCALKAQQQAVCLGQDSGGTGLVQQQGPFAEAVAGAEGDVRHATGAGADVGACDLPLHDEVHVAADVPLVQNALPSAV